MPTFIVQDQSKRGLDTRVSLKGALAAQGFIGGTRGATEWNQWMESEKQELAKVMEKYGIQWKQLGTHNRHLSVLDYEKQERIREVAELDQALIDGKAELSEIVSQRVSAEQETECMKKKSEEIHQEAKKLSVQNTMLKQETDGLVADRKKLLSDNEELEKQQKKLQKEIEKMANSKAVLERNIHSYDEDAKWQLPEVGAFVTAKIYRDKSAMPLVEGLKDVVKSLTIKCVNLMEQDKKLRVKVKKQADDIDFYKEKMQRQNVKLEQLQEQADDLERIKRYFGVDKIDAAISEVKQTEHAVRIRQQNNRAYRTSR